ncbi:MAG TPA: glutamate--tRNA ligase [Actinomycetes bacterium]|nr:glutamate--tRNA ligase [Actinomycetes bacterium]
MADRDVPAGTVRTRFAPSPTGFLHVGTARTALFNYLFARAHGGRLVLRIEDTDVERNVPGGAEGIVDALRWLGLTWDEGYAVGGEGGPYVQSERLDRYRTAVNTLIATGHAYPCYCSPEELERRAAARRARGLPPGYDGHCRELAARQVRAYEAEGRQAAVRFRLPDEGRTVVHDLVHGTVAFENATLSDFVILRASGMPTYLLAAVYDDVDMRISHVIRGDDLLPSTPRQLHVFAALGRPDPPAFAHLPLLVGADGKKLSKRHGAVAVETFRAEGYLPEALVNYLALLGWSYDDRTELFGLDELERVFSIERVTQNPAAFDTRKLDALDGHHLRALDPGEFARRALPFVRAAGLPEADADTLAAAAPLVQERVRTLGEVPGMVGFLYADRVEIDEADAARVLDPQGREFLAAAAAALAPVEPWTAEAIEATLRGLQQERGLGAKKAFQPVRLAVTGRLVSPPLFESMALLGKARSLGRIEALTPQGV